VFWRYELTQQGLVMTYAAHRLDRLALLCAAVLAAGFASRAHAEEYVKSYTVAGRPNVRVHVSNGDVRVITSDSHEVQFRVTYRGFTLDRNLHIDSRQNGDEVELTTSARWGIVIGISIKHMSTEVLMPRDADLQLETRDGTVEVVSMSGTIRIRSGDGRITARQLSGTIDLQARDGGISADTLKGDLRLHSGDGTIEATNLDGKCDISSGDGSVHLAGRFDALDIKTGDGGVTARVAAGSKLSSSWNIRTGDGPVDLALPKDLSASLDASTGDGHISLGLPVTMEGTVSPSRVHGTMNGGGPALIIHTGDGSIRINGS
jgi:DUF4097 and DUF4098 domain-containing protein YvlB